MGLAMEFCKASRDSTIGALLWGLMKPVGLCEVKPLGALLWGLCNGASLQSFAVGLSYRVGVRGQFPKECLLLGIR